MKAVLYCHYIVTNEDKKYPQEVFVMPCDAFDFQHISSPCASCNSKLSRKICYAIANNSRDFEIDQCKYYIPFYKVFDLDYVNQYREPPLIDFTSEIDHPVTIHVYGWKTICSISKHNVKDVRAIVLNLNNNEPTIINIFHCLTYDRYWIHKKALNLYQKHKIYPCVRFRYYDEHFNNNLGLQRESTLKQYGYNVRSGGMTKSERHNCLSSLISHSVLERYEIVDHLDFCIRLHKNLPHMEASVNKWNDDIDFLLYLPPTSQDTVLGYVDKL